MMGDSVSLVPSAWNSLPSHVQEITSTSTFKRQLKMFCFRKLTSVIPSYFVFISLSGFIVYCSGLYYSVLVSS